MSPDFDFSDVGPFTLVTPMNDEAREHLAEHTDGTWQAGSLVVEPRYAPELSADLCRDGFSVELPDGRVVTADDLA